MLNVHENNYWFDAETGAIVKAIVRRVEFRGGSSTTSIVQYEWELEPKLVITPPASRP